MSEQVPVQAGVFRTGADGSPHLVGGRCRTCQRPHFPVLTTCPWCSADEVDEVELSAAGTLWGWTAVTAPPPGYQGEVPFGFGVVELPEGLRVVTRLTESDPGRLAFGDAVELAIVPLHTDDGREVVTWAFAPAGAA